MASSRRRLFVTAALAASVVAGIGLSGCSGPASKSSSAGTADFGTVAGTAGAAGTTAAASGAPGGAAVAPSASSNAATGDGDGDRAVVRTASVTIGTNTVDSVADRVVALASAAGERVDGDQRNNDDDARTADLTLRVRPERLNTVIASIDRMGHEISRSVKGDDVTATKADRDAQILALQTSVDRLRNFLSQSSSVSSLLAVETQLSQRQQQLDGLRAQQRALADEVSLATLTVQVVQNGTPPAVARSTGPAGFGSALGDGWHGLVVAWRWVLAAAGYVLPIGLVVAVLLGLAGAGWRRRRGHVRTGRIIEAEPRSSTP